MLAGVDLECIIRIRWPSLVTSKSSEPGWSARAGVGGAGGLLGLRDEGSRFTEVLAAVGFRWGDFAGGLAACLPLGGDPSRAMDLDIRLMSGRCRRTLSRSDDRLTFGAGFSWALGLDIRLMLGRCLRTRSRSDDRLERLGSVGCRAGGFRSIQGAGVMGGRSFSTLRVKLLVSLRRCSTLRRRSGYGRMIGFPLAPDGDLEVSLSSDCADWLRRSSDFSLRLSELLPRLWDLCGQVELTELFREARLEVRRRRPCSLVARGRNLRKESSELELEDLLRFHFGLGRCWKQPGPAREQ